MKIYDDAMYSDDCKNLITGNGLRKQKDQKMCSSQNITLVSKPKDSQYLAYVVVMCSNAHISGQMPNSTTNSTGAVDHTDEGGITREGVAFLIVIMDCIIMLVFLVIIWITEYLIQLEVNRHNSLLPECK